MANTLNLGNGNWAVKKDSLLGYNSENGNYKPLPFDFTRASSGTTVNQSGLIETVGSGIPRIDFQGNTKGALLLEPSRTNLITYSENFSQTTWQKQTSGTASSPIVTSNYAISPNGTLNADRVVFNLNGGTTVSDFSQLADGVISSIGDVTNSIWIKSNTASNYNMSFVDPNANYTSIVVTNEWKRFDVTSTTVSTSSALRLRLRGNESTSDYADVSIWGAQVEQGSYATSYIPTSGSAVTRIADVCNNGANEQVINSTEGVLYAEIQNLTSLVSLNNWLTISDGTTSNFVALVFETTGTTVGRITVGGVTQAFFSIIGNYSLNQKLAFKWKENDFAFWINGVEVGTDSVGSVPNANTLDKLQFNYPPGGNNLYGKVKDIRVYNEALTDAQLKALTT